MGKIGLTTTVPVEVIYAAGEIPVDLNNIFITGSDAMNRVEEAELAGFPRSVCGWIKGLYSTALQHPEIRRIIAVTQGDCSNTHALMETWEVEGIEIIPFAFPYDRDSDMIRLQMDKLITSLGAAWDGVSQQKRRLDQVRALAWEIDRLTWEENRVSGFENHLYQVSCSDFNGDPEGFAREMEEFIGKARQREPLSEKGRFSGRKKAREVRLGFIGVPPIFPELYDFVESHGARVVYNEVQRQFTMPFQTNDVVEQYRLYTYPYQVFQRIDDISREAEQRQLDGIIHYTQSFCYRQIEDLIIRKKLDYPILTLEGENPTGLDARSKMRIESFLSMLED
ncbi:Benzoyl-CoA reductase/2-hydroxyglutaryl-CoA dehydratase subunit, BcrC/BadD/HgdB [Desulfosporosinus acidiphilus SJ4]|uniref:Benzoyl-CoA reductase/2-hydroxyglutaryl-CoA dehydratase subunit, BcrC/BadD/HgdB n=1 Tax=Desulfosporosinus acidiphilus (strain DSM 22704 / JCM 16185 / SJ4) TaxID=646529 RepID=I4DBP2_DESAJ|nr:2-hydroxyacyl-CoA dehydratase family protein [Desulfosporosinus acidiphilus]AFM43216.1 Benzoyl-CoA reductase/2-hydroxyglutaryl-CoA dehydratase subunit, BcrC/BadD/HgdB [Desulfosporosinus acidiphilus SJ4]